MNYIFRGEREKNSSLELNGELEADVVLNFYIYF